MGIREGVGKKVLNCGNGFFCGMNRMNRMNRYASQPCICVYYVSMHPCIPSHACVYPMRDGTEAL